MKERTRLSYKSTLVILPPSQNMVRVQEFRKIHDRQFRRWPPHVNILYPFLEKSTLDEAILQVREALRNVDTFEVELKKASYFVHKSGRCTVYLVPDPVERIREIHGLLLARFPYCTRQSSFEHGYTPHLSIGQARNRKTAEILSKEAAESICPLSFTIKSVFIMTRMDPPEDIFRVAHEIGLQTERMP